MSENTAWYRYCNIIYMKEEIIRMVERDFLHSTLLEEFLKYPDQTQIEEIEIIKGNFKTNVTLRFTDEGFPLSCMYESNYIPTDEDVELFELDEQLDRHIEDRNWEAAGEVQRQIRERTNN